MAQQELLAIMRMVLNHYQKNMLRYMLQEQLQY